MAATSRTHAALTQLRDTLKARPTLAGVQIVTADPGDEAKPETIVLYYADIEQDWAALGNRSRSETVIFEGYVGTLKPGKGEAIAEAARDRAFTLLAEIEDALSDDPTIGGTVLTAQCRPTAMDQSAVTAGRICMVRFEIAYTARLIRS